MAVTNFINSEEERQHSFLIVDVDTSKAAEMTTWTQSNGAWRLRSYGCHLDT
jgi:hypothetical protein